MFDTVFTKRFQSFNRTLFPQIFHEQLDLSTIKTHMLYDIVVFSSQSFGVLPLYRYLLTFLF